MTPPGELHLFARAPVEGRGKSRLAATRGTEFAAALSRAFLRDLARLLRLPGTRTVLRLDGPPEGLPPEVRGAEVIAQRAGGLGGRIADAFEDAFRRVAPFALVAGSDSPAEGPERVLEAADVLRGGAPAVIRAADDGGFVLLGLRREAFSRDLFDGVPWSTSGVAAEVEGALIRRGAEPVRLAPGFDVDVEADLLRLGAELRARPEAAPATAAFLRERGLLPERAGAEENPES